MKVLVLGSGGREHAIAETLFRSPQVGQGDLFVAPGNAGTRAIAENVAWLDPCDPQAVTAFALENEINLVVVGPEAPLVAGVADALRRAGVPVFGPDAQGAQLEGSKSFSKQFMVEHGLPTAAYADFDDADAALRYIDELGAPCVVKADGLAAGKGVVVAETIDQAKDAVRSCFGGAFGESGARVVVEECLTGPECSMLALVADGHATCLPAARDHKRAHDGDTGPNTGGMGAFCPVEDVRAEDAEAMRRIMTAAAAATKTAFAHDFRGVLYGGFMLTAAGPKLLEFNVRFGDPETQAILPLLEGDFAQALLDVALATPASTTPDTSGAPASDATTLAPKDACSVCVVLASAGYPGAYETGKPIVGLDEAAALQREGGRVHVFHAGTKLDAEGRTVTAGGRVLAVTAVADSFPKARELAYEACAIIDFEGKQLRHDIGAAL